MSAALMGAQFTTIIPIFAKPKLGYLKEYHHGWRFEPMDRHDPNLTALAMQTWSSEKEALAAIRQECGYPIR